MLVHKPTSSTQVAAFNFLTHGGMSPTMLCNAALMVRLSNFYSIFKPNFSRIFFEFQVVRASNRSTIEGPLYIGLRIYTYITYTHTYIHNT